MAPKGKEDPIERIGRMIDEKVASAFEGRDQREKEAKDPWARLEGMIDRAVGKRFDSFLQSLGEAEAEEAGAGGKGKGEKADDDEGDGDGLLKVLGL